MWCPTKPAALTTDLISNCWLLARTNDLAMATDYDEGLRLRYIFQIRMDAVSINATVTSEAVSKEWHNVFDLEVAHT